MRLSFRKKTLSKILMCSCNAQKFQDEGNEYVKKLLHFHFHCQDCYFFYVYTWKWHPFVAARIPEMDLCANIGLQEICNFCVQIRYLLNFTACKLCLKKIPINFQEHLVPILRACMAVSYVFITVAMPKRWIFLCIIPKKTIWQILKSLTDIFVGEKKIDIK